ncbi:hypothetical protein ACGFK1_32100 [Mycobacterium sp. NPDC048908]|uniref:hypothetical protein n=1 Tax=Mycobacterium sp. NPDC048908 TaxID=3364292 RepID=UPI00371FE018
MATFWRYVKIQLMMFVFGIVGPIFLIIFFATQPDPTMKWAYWAGLFITAADVLIAIALTKASDPDKAPADVRLAVKVAQRLQGGSVHISEGSASTYDPFSSTALSFASTDSGSTSSSDYSTSSDYSSGTDYSSTDSGSSSSDSGSSSSSSD